MVLNRDMAKVQIAQFHGMARAAEERADYVARDRLDMIAAAWTNVDTMLRCNLKRYAGKSALAWAREATRLTNLPAGCC